MAIEIERKFLVSGDFLHEATSSTRIVQGYICTEPGRSVRVRIRGDEAFLTIKGASDEKGLSRYEFETKIPIVDAERLMELCVSGVIDKVRYLVPKGNHTWEVDVFHGENEGLVLAEIELASEDEPFERPSWLGQEVSGDRRYYNSMLTIHPFNSFNT
ncbi:Uncharacterized conserved protein UCP016487, CYTH region [gut metagenome]|uniref:Uncharacterized conserved protein UCP016487, CYTH region n=1 Tax=gut metagenome TaxID=749906 RepID=J9G623_9ZZZZ